MWRRSGKVASLLWAFGCADAEPSSPDPDALNAAEQGSEQPPSDEAQLPLPQNGEAFSLVIDDWTDTISAKAQLLVSEGVPLVGLEIIGTGRRDVLLMDASFNGLEDSWLPHRWEVGLPGAAWHSAIAQIDGQSYHSQGGSIDVSMSADGSISGSFEVALAKDPEIAVGEPVLFEQGETARVLTGIFGGQWQLFCQSRLAGHRSLMQGGDYCDALELE